MGSHYHPGEVAVQRRADVTELAAGIEAGIHAAVPPVAAAFLVHQPFAVIAFLDRDRRPRARMLTAPAHDVALVEAVDETTVLVRADLARLGVQPGDPVGSVLVELASRRRMRLNGRVAAIDPRATLLRVEQVYANCKKYVQAREPVELGGGAPVRAAWFDRVSAADTFFLATGTAQAGMDASHRGGMRGFVQVVGPSRLLVPDYAGNTMFNSLGNLELDPRAALLFVDFADGSATEILGRARVLWNDPRQASFPGAERLVEVEVERVEGRDAETPLRWRLTEYSRFNPPLRVQP